MRTFEDALNLLTVLSKDVVRLERAHKEILNSSLQAADKADRADRIAADIATRRQERIRVLEDLVTFPPRHLQYAALVDQFWKVAPNGKSVFIMTKYPDGIDPAKDAQLKRVIDAVTNAVEECGFIPQLANNKKWHPNLWENLELYMLACSRGIAVVEGQFNERLNPNVAMEWGWLRGMGRPVLYLVETQVEVIPPDVSGLLKDRFDWNNPEPAIRKAVFLELTGAEPIAQPPGN
jgi:hypothetical protein